MRSRAHCPEYFGCISASELMLKVDNGTEHRGACKVRGVKRRKVVSEKRGFRSNLRSSDCSFNNFDLSFNL